MPSPVPSSRVAQAIPASSMDCVRRGGGEQTLAEDNQRFEVFPSATAYVKSDCKLLWHQDLIPFRTITLLGASYNATGFGDFISMMESIMGDEGWWERADVTVDFVNYTNPQWGQDYDVWDFEKRQLMPSSEAGYGGTPFLASGWHWTLFGATVSPPSPVDKNLLYKLGTLTQIICPSAFKPIKYELWTVTDRLQSFFPTGEGDPGLIPSPFPWSSSSDFAKVKADTLNPGQTLVIPCPVNQDPGSPAFTGFKGDIAYNGYEGWGVTEYIYFPPPG